VTHPKPVRETYYSLLFILEEKVHNLPLCTMLVMVEVILVSERTPMWSKIKTCVDNYIFSITCDCERVIWLIE